MFQSFFCRIADVFFPPHCVVCSRRGAFVCDACLVVFPLREQQCCPVCYIEARNGRVCDPCRIRTRLDGLLVALPYEYLPLKRLIKRMKYKYAEDLSVRLARLLAKVLPDVKRREEMTLCSVPLYSSKMRQRGFNQAELLARALSECRELEFLDILERTRATDMQSQLGRDERRKNVNGAFTLQANIQLKGHYIIVDDIASTLSTLNECAKVLKGAGARSVWGLVLARGRGVGRS